MDEVFSGQLLDALSNSIDLAATSGIPVISIWRESKKQNRLQEQGLATAQESWKYGTLSVVSKAAGAVGGGKIGAIVGSFIFPGAGTLIGGIIGSFLGAAGGTVASAKWKIKDLRMQLIFIIR